MTVALLVAEVSGIWIAVVGAFGIVLAASVAAISPLILAKQIEKQSIAKEQREVQRQERVASEAKRQQDEVAAEAKRQQDEVAEEARRRQQEVADQVTETARLAQERTDATDLALGRVARIAAESQAETAQQLGAIKITADHTLALVNSNLSNAKESQLSAMKDRLIVLEEIHDLKKAGGLEPTAAALTTMEDAKTQIDALQLEVDQRTRQTQLAEAEAAKASESAHPQNVVIVNHDPVDVSIKEKLAKDDETTAESE